MAQAIASPNVNTHTERERDRGNHDHHLSARPSGIDLGVCLRVVSPQTAIDGVCSGAGRPRLRGERRCQRLGGFQTWGLTRTNKRDTSSLDGCVRLATAAHLHPPTHVGQLAGFLAGSCQPKIAQERALSHFGRQEDSWIGVTNWAEQGGRHPPGEGGGALKKNTPQNNKPTRINTWFGGFKFGGGQPTSSYHTNVLPLRPGPVVALAGVRGGVGVRGASARRHLRVHVRRLRVRGVVRRVRVAVDGVTRSARHRVDHPLQAA